MSNRPAYTYDPLRVSIKVGNVTIDGYAEGVFFRGARDFDNHTKQVGTQGDTIIVRMPKDQATVSVILHAGSAVNADLEALVANGDDGKTQVVDFLMKDNNGGDRVEASKVWIQRTPDIEKGGEPGTNEWTIGVHDYQITHGGLEQA